MTDNETIREKTFSEELPYFKERIKEVFDNYDNPNGYEDPLYIAVLRDSKRIVRKAEEEIKMLRTGCSSCCGINAKSEFISELYEQIEYWQRGYNDLLQQIKRAQAKIDKLNKENENLLRLKRNGG